MVHNDDKIQPQGYECDCPCGGVMLRKTITIEASTYPVKVECPRCGRTPLDLLTKDVPGKIDV